MHRSPKPILIVLVLASALLLGAGCRPQSSNSNSTNNNSSSPMFITLPQLRDGRIPVKFTCDGDSVNPEISIADVPADAKSLALHVVDYDVPKSLRADGTYHHWILWNIAPGTKLIEQDRTPTGAIEGRNSSGTNGYVGPCPPDREHRYIFRVFALDATLDLPATTTAESALAAIQPHEITRGEAVGTYNRSK